MSESLIEEYQNKLDEEIDSVSRYVLKGKCVDHAEYLARISEIHAYTRAKENFQRSMKDYMEQEDDELPTMEKEKDE